MSGVRTLEDMRDRCVVDDVTGCWLWRSGTTGDGQPKVHAVVDGKVMSTTGGRVVWTLARGPIPPKHVVYRPRCSKLCLNPTHLRCGPKAKAGEILSATGRLRGDPRRSIINQRNRCSTKVILDLDKARAIRASNESALELAIRYGTSKTTILDVRAMRRWREPGWSAFSRLAA